MTIGMKKTQGVFIRIRKGLIKSNVKITEHLFCIGDIFLMTQLPLPLKNLLPLRLPTILYLKVLLLYVLRTYFIRKVRELRYDGFEGKEAH